MTRGETRKLITQLNRDAKRIAHRFGLRYRSIEAERANVKRRYGICYSDGTIKIRLRHVVSGEPLKYSSLVNTLCHELAHLRHFNHGPQFKTFYLMLLGWSRSQGIYRPKRNPVPAASGMAGPVRAAWRTASQQAPSARTQSIPRPPTGPAPTRPRVPVETPPKDSTRAGAQQLELF